MGRAQNDRETSQDIVNMLRASMQTLHAVDLLSFYEKAPGIRYAIKLIEDAFQLEKK